MWKGDSRWENEECNCVKMKSEKCTIHFVAKPVVWVLRGKGYRGVQDVRGFSSRRQLSEDNGNGGDGNCLSRADMGEKR